MRARRGCLHAGVGLALLLGITSAGCERSVDASPPPPAPTPVVTVTMRDYSFHVNRPLPEGRAVFRMVNLGKESHSPALIPLDDSFPPILEQIHGSVRREIHELAVVNSVEPGRTASFAVNLEGGRRYALVCYSVRADGVAHRDLGMAWESRAASPKGHGTG